MIWSNLTDEQRKDIESKVRVAVRGVGMPITTTRWAYVDGLQQWQLLIATTWIDQKGRETTNRALTDALRKANIDAPMNGVVLDSSQKGE